MHPSPSLHPGLSLHFDRNLHPGPSLHPPLQQLQPGRLKEQLVRMFSTCIPLVYPELLGHSLQMVRVVGWTVPACREAQSE